MIERTQQMDSKIKEMTELDLEKTERLQNAESELCKLSARGSKKDSEISHLKETNRELIELKDGLIEENSGLLEKIDATFQMESSIDSGLDYSLSS